MKTATQAWNNEAAPSSSSTAAATATAAPTTTGTPFTASSTNSAASRFSLIAKAKQLCSQCNLRTQLLLLFSPAGLSLATLVIQNTSLVLMTRYSRFSFAPKDTYHTSTMVLNQELLKMVFCLFALMYEKRLCFSFRGYCSYLWSDVVYDRETLKLAIPAALFTVQNYLIFISLSHLDAMTFQVLSQTKLLSAAVFSVWLLERHLNRMQWTSLGILTFGVLLANAQGTKESGGGANPDAASQSPLSHQQRQHHHHIFLLGVAACVTSGLSSSFAGVYFEKVVKTTAPSLAVRNIHLSLFGIPFAVLSMFFVDIIPSWNNSRSSEHDFSYFRGYNAFTWCLVAVHALGGLLVAVVVKYADNILKGFATGIAIIASGVFTAFFWGYVPSVPFVCGCFLVIASSIMYHVADKGSHTLRRTDAEEQEQELSPTIVSKDDFGPQK